jgi:hypothetical protein
MPTITLTAEEQAAWDHFQAQTAYGSAPPGAPTSAKLRALEEIRPLGTSLEKLKTGIEASVATADLSELIDDRIDALITEDSNFSLVYNDAGNAMSLALASNLDIVGRMALGSSAGVNDPGFPEFPGDLGRQVLNIRHTESGLTAGGAPYLTGLDVQYTLNNATGYESWVTIGVNIDLGPASGDSAIYDYMYGVKSIASGGGTGSAFGIYGGFFSGVADASFSTGFAYGVAAEATLASSSTLDLAEARAATMRIINLNTTKKITTAYGAYVTAANSGTIDALYGVYVADITSGTNTATPWSFYAADVNARSYFAGENFIGAKASAPTDGDIPVSTFVAYLDESGNNLMFRVRKSDGTYKTGTVAIS